MEFQVKVQYVLDLRWITFMVENRLVSAPEQRFSKDLVKDISRSTTLNYLNETNIRLLVFPFPLETSKF